MTIGKGVSIGCEGGKQSQNIKAFGLSTGRIGFHLLRKGISGKEWVWREK